MTSRPQLGISAALLVKPLVEGLDAPDAIFGLAEDIPSALAVRFNDRPDTLRGAFLSPIDYARHGAEYQIVPGIAASSREPTGTAKLFINDGVKDINSIAVDVRVTSEIILARILLLEKFPNLSSGKQSMQFIPMMPDLGAMLNKADAALVVNIAASEEHAAPAFSLDLVEEWNDLTGLPYVHGLWVVREGKWSPEETRALQEARDLGLQNLPSIARRHAASAATEEEHLDYLSAFSYDMGEDQENSLSEFLRYAYYHGVIRDVPELNFASPASPPSSSVH